MDIKQIENVMVGLQVGPVGFLNAQNFIFCAIIQTNLHGSTSISYLLDAYIMDIMHVGPIGRPKRQEFSNQEIRIGLNILLLV